MLFRMHKFLIKAFILISLPLLFLYPTHISAQGWDWENLNVEVGAEYNIMMIKAWDYSSDQNIYRNDDDFGLRPRMEINYKLDLSDRFNLNPFIRYSNRGRTENVTRDEFTYYNSYDSSLPTFSAGGKLYYHIFSFQVAPVLALNRHLGNNKGDVYSVKADVGDLKDFSIDAGLSLRYGVNDHLYVTADGMYGITNLYQQATISVPAGSISFKAMRLFYTSFNLGFSL